MTDIAARVSGDHSPQNIVGLIKHNTRFDVEFLAFAMVSMF